jgi:dipeptidase E
VLGWGGFFLVSHGLAGLTEFLDRTGSGSHAVFIPTAANRLAETAFVDELRSDLTMTGLRLRDLDVEAGPVGDALEDADVVAVGGGDPFFLLECSRRAGLGEAVRALVDRGGVYLGVSAGASIAGPDLTPLTLTSPFTAPPELDLTGLGLCDVIVLPHDDRPGRRRKNRKAIRTYGDRWRIVALTDGQAVTIVDGTVSVR